MVRVDRSAYDLLTDDGPGRVPVFAADVTVGDWLALAEDGTAALLPRTSLLVRGASSGVSRSQPLAANVDVVMVVVSLSASIAVRRVERLLTLAWESGAAPVVVLTKADLHPDPDAAVEALLPHAPGVPVVVTRAAEGDVTALAPYSLPGTTLVLLGASGAGKSTVVNALAGGEVMATGDVREVDGKGRHTTTHRELVVLPSGAVVIDTPGLRGVALAGSDQGLAKAFSDVEDLAAACRFADCAHVGEPGCAVQASIDAGDLSAARMESWHRLQRELAFQARRTDLRLRAEEKQKWKVLHKAHRARGART
ncbi:MAG: putative ATP/GTP-binding protein [Frankiales bacterium]|nr:putative ATP/GTP-binding protein [Frankiales bacterium]